MDKDVFIKSDIGAQALGHDGRRFRDGDGRLKPLRRDALRHLHGQHLDREH